LLLSNQAHEQGGSKIDEVRQLLDRLNKKPIDVVADYLRKLWNHTLKIIELKLTKIALDNMALRVVITVPATWDHAAQELTRKAAIQAGITAPRYSGQTSLKLVSEPEAAALATWKDSGLQSRPDLIVSPT
jgi:molecular chaperone DnaK (HSP70)